MPFKRVDNVWFKAYGELLMFKPGCIKDAPEKIARSMESLGCAPNMLINFDFNNYQLEAVDFVSIEVVMRLLFEGCDPQGLQLASNFGPYLHYLRTERNFTNFLGIDIDPLAKKYADDIGVPVILASATAIPLANESQEVVISYHFLDWLYTRVFDLGSRAPIFSDGPPSNSPFIISVLKEIWRILKPEGVFISSLENLNKSALAHGGNPFRDPITFSDEVISKRHLEELYIFQKSV